MLQMYFPLKWGTNFLSILNNPVWLVFDIFKNKLYEYDKHCEVFYFRLGTPAT